jgi:hypothetical protein
MAKRKDNTEATGVPATANDTEAGDQAGHERPGKGGNFPPLATRWRPGQSGNPAGRKKADPWLEAITLDMLEDPIPEVLHKPARVFLGMPADGPLPKRVKEMTNWEFLTRHRLFAAQTGKDPRAGQDIVERVLGKVPQPITAPEGSGRLTPSDEDVLVIEMTEAEYHEELKK